VKLLKNRKYKCYKVTLECENNGVFQGNGHRYLCFQVAQINLSQKKHTIKLEINENGKVLQVIRPKLFRLDRLFDIDCLISQKHKAYPLTDAAQKAIHQTSLYYFERYSDYVKRNIDELGLLFLLASPKTSKLSEYLKDPTTLYLLAEEYRKSKNIEKYYSQKRALITYNILKSDLIFFTDTADKKTNKFSFTKSQYKFLQKLEIQKVHLQCVEYTDILNVALHDRSLKRLYDQLPTYSFKELAYFKHYLTLDKQPIGMSAREIVKLYSLKGERFINDINEMANNIGDSKKFKKLVNCNNYDELCELHDKLLEHLSCLQEERLIDEPKSMLPDYRNIRLKIHIEGSAQIIPLLTYDDFRLESNVMNNCLAYADYFNECSNGQLAIYNMGVSLKIAA